MTTRHTQDPPNSEVALADLGPGSVPNDLFYTRCNFPVPRIDLASWRLETAGAFEVPRPWTMDELVGLPAVERTVTLECAGNGRTLMTPVPPGTPWRLGAVGTARFTGVRLADYLDANRLASAATELIFTGADRGTVEPEGQIAYEFNLDVATARADGPMLAWAMDGHPLSAEHGFPLRLVVPGHYGMRSVKWLTRITAVERPFTGHFARKYRYRGERDVPDETPVGPIRVRSLFTWPPDAARLPPGAITLRGIAWSGGGQVERVEVMVGSRWIAANVAPPLDGTGHVAWTFDWIAPSAGTHVLAVRATDAGGDRQPESSVWNEGGYGNNTVHRISVRVARR